MTPNQPGTVETLAWLANFFDSILSPITAIALGGGPMKTMPVRSSAAENSAFSERKP